MINPIIDFAAACGPARDQAGRGTCLAFASSDFNRRINVSNDHLRVDYLAHHAIKVMNGWKAGDGLTVSAAISALKMPGQPLETLYAYDATDHARPLSPVPPNVGQLFTSKPTLRKLSPKNIETGIAAGKPVCLAIALSNNFFVPDNGIITYGPDYLKDAVHAVVAVGLGTHSKTQVLHVLIRNSWGSAWGEFGHAWLPVQYLHTHLVDSFAL